MAKSNGLRFRRKGVPLAALLLIGAFAAGSATFLALHDAAAPGVKEEIRLTLPAPAGSSLTGSDSAQLPQPPQLEEADPSSPEAVSLESPPEQSPRMTAVDPSVPLTSSAPQSDEKSPEPQAPKDTEVAVSAAVLGDRSVSLLYIRPVDGKTLKSWSAGELVYSETLEDYRVHRGTDLAASLGTPVHAMADGVLSDLYDDDLFGRVIEISHEGGIVTRYCNLQPAGLAGVRIGSSVKMGDIIAEVGESALCECGEAPHLHLEVLQNGQPIDPESLFR